MSYDTAGLLSLSFVWMFGTTWRLLVAQSVPAPYLDEFFHVRQAEQYWIGNWHIWDSKITTPPGLYLVSYAWLAFRIPSFIDAELINQLRSINIMIGIPGIFLAVYYLTGTIQADEAAALPAADSPDGSKQAVDVQTGNEGFTSSLARNVALFPPLFFFSGLYYTDVLSILAVLLCYLLFQQRQQTGVIAMGLASLWFRQNNIFWCGIFLAGLEVVRSLERIPDSRRLIAYSDIPGILNESWTRGQYYDPLLDAAGVEDYIVSTITIAIAAVVNLSRLIPRLMPYLLILTAFAAFVAWNGSVVLGDKSNHVASLHLPQMLYIWPYFAFFSPFAIITPVLARLERVAQSKQPLNALGKVTPRLLIIILTLALSTAAVNLNTIIHPFTLADNRHYTFYVFRILRLNPALWYAAIPVYIACAWAVLTALGSSTGQNTANSKPTKPKQNTSSLVQVDSILSRNGNRVSFVLIWTISSALGLITAPLVEPRYYILPWIMWRLHVPAVSKGLTGGKSPIGRIGAWASILETAWALAINGVTMWLFLNKGFEWKQEPGAVQRFMW